MRRRVRKLILASLFMLGGVSMMGIHEAWGTGSGPDCYVGFDGNDWAVGEGVKYENLNRLFNEKVPVDYADGLVGKARRMKVLPYMSSCSIGGMGGVGYFFPGVTDLGRQGTLAFWWKDEELNDPYADIRNHPLYKDYADHYRNFPFLTKLPDYGSAVILNSAALSIDSGAGARAVSFADDILPKISDRKSWNHVALSWSRDTGKCVVYVNKKKVGEFGLGGDTNSAPAVLVLFKDFPGWVDEAGVWKRVLDAKDIGAVHDMGKKGKALMADADVNVMPLYMDSMAAKNVSGKRPDPVAEKINWALSEKPDMVTESMDGYFLDGLWWVQLTGSDGKAPVDEKERAVAAGELLEDRWAFGNCTEIPRPRIRPQVEGEKSSIPSPHFPKGYLTGKGGDVLARPMLWLDREVVIPKEWSSDGVYLRIHSPVATGGKEEINIPLRVYLNGVFLGEIFSFETAVLRLNDKMKPGEKNLIRILLGRPGYVSVLPTPGNITLERHKNDRGVAIRNVLTHPRMNPNRLEADVRIQVFEPIGNAEVSCELRDFATGEKIASLPADKIKLDKTGEQAARVSHEWKDPLFWDLDNPRLLMAYYELNAGGKVIDAPPPVRFGFRTLEWDKGRDLLLNGRPVSLRGQSHNGIEPYVGGIPYYEVFGMNASREYSTGRFASSAGALADYSNRLNYLDELGHFASLCFYRFLGGREAGAMFDPNATEPARRLVERIGNHPAWVVSGYTMMSYMPGPWGHPHTIGARAGKDYDPNAWDAKMFRKICETYRSFEQDRPLGSFRHGCSYDLACMMTYYGNSIPLQTREEIMKYWSENGDKPFFGNEVDLVMIGDETLFQRGYGLHNPSSARIEWCAQYFGDRPYVQVTEEQAANLTYNDMKQRKSSVTGGPGEDAAFWGTVEKAMKSKEGAEKAGGAAELLKKYGLDRGIFQYCPQFEEFFELVFRGSLCAWRTYGYNYLIHTNFKPDQMLGRGNQWTRQARAAFKYNSPVLVFIGGEPEHFTRKDHAYFSGEKIGKQIICKNDRFSPVKIELDWSLLDKKTGKAVDKGNASVDLQAGELRKIPVAVTAPTVADRAEYELKVDAKVNGESRILPVVKPHVDSTLHASSYAMAKKLLETHSDTYGESMDIQVFPKAAGQFPNLEGKKIVLVDKVGDTAALLDAAKVKYERREKIDQWDIPQTDVFIFGRNSMDLEWEVTLMEYDNLINHFKKGHPTVIIFEQNMESVFGLKVERVQARYAFIRDPNSPVLAGLSNADFANWRGEADLVPPYSDDWKKTEWNTGVGYRYPSRHWPNYKVLGKGYRFPLWSGNGMVCTLAYVKPHTGPFRSLLDCGFDLLYSPLLEEKRENGRILYCMLDVSNRYGKDPVATKLVNQLLEYAANAGTNDHQWRPVYVLPDTRLFRLASEEELLLATTPESVDKWDRNALVIANAGSGQTPEVLKKDPEGLKKFLEEGGELLLFWAKPESDLSYLPFKLSVNSEARFATKDPEKVDVLRGIGPGDMFFRMIFSADVVADDDRKGQVTDSGLVYSRKVGKGRLTLCQIEPETFRMRKNNRYWQWPKAMRVISGILYNLGAQYDSATNPEGGRTSSLYLLDSPEFDPYRRVTW